MYRCSQCASLKKAPAHLDLNPSSPWFKCPCGGTLFSDELTGQIRGQESSAERTRAGGFAHEKLLGTLIVVGGVALVAAAAILFAS